MNVNELLGTLTISFFVNVPNGRTRRATLARYHHVYRDECEEKRDEFLAVNPNINPGMVEAEWVCRDPIYPR